MIIRSLYDSHFFLGCAITHQIIHTLIKRKPDGIAARSKAQQTEHANVFTSCVWFSQRFYFWNNNIFGIQHVYENGLNSIYNVYQDYMLWSLVECLWGNNGYKLKQIAITDDIISIKDTFIVIIRSI